MRKCTYCLYPATNTCECNGDVMCGNHIGIHTDAYKNLPVHLIEAIEFASNQDLGYELTMKINVILSKLKTISFRLLEMTQYLIGNIEALHKNAMEALVAQKKFYKKLLIKCNNRLTVEDIAELRFHTDKNIEYVELHASKKFLSVINDYYFQSSFVSTDFKINEAQGLIDSPVSLICLCRICNAAINDSFYREIPECRGYIHNKCLLDTMKFFANQNTVYFGFICAFCQKFHQILTKELKNCSSCLVLTVKKEQIDEIICLKCMGEAPTVNLDHKTLEGALIYRSLSKIAIEDYQSINQLCSSCGGIPDLLMVKGHWNCYSCIFYHNKSSIDLIKCERGCCTTPLLNRKNHLVVERVMVNAKSTGKMDTFLPQRPKTANQRDKSEERNERMNESNIVP